MSEPGPVPSCPRLEIDLGAVAANTRSLVVRLGAVGIGVTAVTKAALGSPALASAVLAGGVAGLGDSRVTNVARLRAGGVVAPITLIRTPMVSEAAAVVASCDRSLNSERRTLAALSVAAVAAHRSHGVVLMVDLGDRREGVLPGELPALARVVLALPGLVLQGIGTNLACRHGVIPDAANMGELSTLATSVEDALGVHLPTVSGGNSANLRWALGSGAKGRVNDLRLGEAILLGRDPLDRSVVPGLRTDGFTLVAEVIESRRAPAAPRGVQAENAFGEPAGDQPRRRGQVVQSILAIGRQDTDPDDLTPAPGIEIVASSSDHLVVESADLLPVGAELTFQPGYRALLRAMTSPFVARTAAHHPADAALV